MVEIEFSFDDQETGVKSLGGLKTPLFVINHPSRVTCMERIMALSHIHDITLNVQLSRLSDQRLTDLYLAIQHAISTLPESVKSMDAVLARFPHTADVQFAADQRRRRYKRFVDRIQVTLNERFVRSSVTEEYLKTFSRDFRGPLPFDIQVAYHCLRVVREFGIKEDESLRRLSLATRIMRVLMTAIDSAEHQQLCYSLLLEDLFLSRDYTFRGLWDYERDSTKVINVPVLWIQKWPSNLTFDQVWMTFELYRLSDIFYLSLSDEEREQICRHTFELRNQYFRYHSVHRTPMVDAYVHDFSVEKFPAIIPNLTVAQVAQAMRTDETDYQSYLDSSEKFITSPVDPKLVYDVETLALIADLPDDWDEMMLISQRRFVFSVYTRKQKLTESVNKISANWDVSELAAVAYWWDLPRSYNLANSRGVTSSKLAASIMGEHQSTKVKRNDAISKRTSSLAASHIGGTGPSYDKSTWFDSLYTMRRSRAFTYRTDSGWD